MTVVCSIWRMAGPRGRRRLNDTPPSMKSQPPPPPSTPGNETTQRLAILAPELRAILRGELAAGNAVVSVEEGRPIKDALTVVLARPFLTPPVPATRNLRYRPLHLPEWWSAEYTTLVPPHTLACRVANDEPAQEPAPPAGGMALT